MIIKAIVDKLPQYCNKECPLKNIDPDACGHWVAVSVDRLGATWTGKVKRPDKRCLLEVAV